MTINRRTMGQAKLLYADSKEIVPAHEYDALASDKADLLRVLGVADARVKVLEAELATERNISAGAIRATVVAEARVAALEAALRSLRNEVGGLNIAKHAIIEAVSRTNWECLMHRAFEADKVLATSETGAKDE